MKWSKWLSFDIVPDYNAAAVYQIRLVVNGRAVPIPRMLGTDKEGLLVIGYTKNLTDRYWQSQKGRLRASGSSTMNLLFYIERYTPMRLFFPGFSYNYRFLQLSSPDEAKLIESQQIKQYVCRFADRPPLNSVLPNRYEGWACRPR
jgi:hypothetical protein